MARIRCKLNKRQERCLELLVKGLTPRKVSEITGESVKTILKWLEDELFLSELSSRVNLGNMSEVEYRLRNNQVLLEELYSVLYHRVHDLKELETLDIKTLMQLTVLIANQIRADTALTNATPEGGINVNLILNQVAERALQSTSFKSLGLDTTKAIEGGNNG